MFRNFIILIVVGVAGGDEKFKNINEPIQYTMRYNQFWNLGANWSTTSRYQDKSTHYRVLNYRNYASSIEEFQSLYPTVTIETRGQAYSSSTIRDVGSGHFGVLTFETLHFTKDPYSVYAVNVHRNAFWWDVGVYIGFEFQVQGENIVITPFINAWIYSAGAVWRELDIGFEATDVTFVPGT